MSNHIVDRINAVLKESKMSKATAIAAIRAVKLRQAHAAFVRSKAVIKEREAAWQDERDKILSELFGKHKVGKYIELPQAAKSVIDAWDAVHPWPGHEVDSAALDLAIARIGKMLTDGQVFGDRQFVRPYQLSDLQSMILNFNDDKNPEDNIRDFMASLGAQADGIEAYNRALKLPEVELSSVSADDIVMQDGRLFRIVKVSHGGKNIQAKSLMKDDAKVENMELVKWTSSVGSGRSERYTVKVRVVSQSIANKMLAANSEIRKYKRE